VNCHGSLVVKIKGDQVAAPYLALKLQGLSICSPVALHCLPAVEFVSVARSLQVWAVWLMHSSQQVQRELAKTSRFFVSPWLERFMHVIDRLNGAYCVLRINACGISPVSAVHVFFHEGLR